MGSIRHLAALLAAAAMLAWVSPSHAAAGFSISIHGGDFRGHGHFHGGYFGHYYGPQRHFRRGFPHHRGYRYFNDKPYWRRNHFYRPHSYYWAPGPRCIYRFGYRYCR